MPVGLVQLRVLGIAVQVLDPTSGISNAEAPLLYK